MAIALASRAPSAISPTSTASRSGSRASRIQGASPLWAALARAEALTTSGQPNEAAPKTEVAASSRAVRRRKRRGRAAAGITGPPRAFRPPRRR